MGLIGQVCCQAIAAEEVSLTLDDAVMLALRDNRDILLKAQDVERTKAKLAESKGALWPALNFTASRINTMDLYAKDIPSTTTQTTLKQYLYKGGKTMNSISRDKFELAAKEALLDREKLDMVLKVKKVFYTTLLAESFVQVSKAILENTKGHLESEHIRYEKGQTHQQDILEIKAALVSVQEAYDVSLNQVAAGRDLLGNLLYLDKDVDVKPVGEFAYQPLDVELDKAFIMAMADRPEIRQYEAEENADKKSVEVAKADTRPSVYASWDYYSRSTTSLTFSPSKAWQDYQIIGVTVSWPIFDGWQTSHKVEQAIADLKQTQLTKEKAVRDIASELKNAYLDLKSAVTKIDSTKAQIDLYKDLVDAAKKRYEAGQLSLLDLMDADIAYKVSLFNHSQALYDYTVAKLSFEKAMGGKG